VWWPQAAATRFVMSAIWNKTAVEKLLPWQCYACTMRSRHLEQQFNR